MIPVILDVDTGSDDALALAYAVASPELDLVAVSTVAGNIDVTKATANTLAVLDWLGAADVPVHQGASHPLVRPHQDAAYFHHEGGLGGARLPVSTRQIGKDRGPAAMIRLARQRPGEITQPGDHPHPLTAAPRRCFDQHWIAERGSNARGFGRIADRVLCARHDGHSGGHG